MEEAVCEFPSNPYLFIFTGGTFVTKGNSRINSELLLAAGGGGSYRIQYEHNGWENILHANTGNEGKSGAFEGGRKGGGGKCNHTNYKGGGGAGFLENGMIPSKGNYKCAYSFRNGGIGGSLEHEGVQEGGFGGGGPGGYGGSGGGGGYSGGCAGNNDDNAAAAGGGGSFNSGTNQSSTVNWEGEGQISITFIGI